MSTHKKSSRAKSGPGTAAKFTALKHEQSTACKPRSVPALPPLICYSVNPPQLSSLGGLSVVELPRLVAKVGTELAKEESVWVEGPGLMASALATDIPFKVINHPPELMSDSVDNVYEDEEKHTRPEESEAEIKSSTDKSGCSPITGIEVFEIFAKKRHLGKLQFSHLKASESVVYSPYNLHVVPRSRAGSDHYIFSPTTVIHVQDGRSVGILPLAEWHREAVIWKALRDIPFFRDYLQCKSLRQWRRNVCQLLFQRKRKVLQSQLLLAVPHFRDALFNLKRLLEELENVPWLLQDGSRTCTLLEFQTELQKINQESSIYMEKFLHYRCLILSMVQDVSIRTQQELHHRLEESKQLQFSSHQASTNSLNKDLKQAERVLQRLGRFAALVDCMIIQNLVTFSRCEIAAFLSNVLKRPQEKQGGLFEAELIFGADGQLTLFPPVQLFQEVLIFALSSVTDSLLQVFDSYSNSTEVKGLMTSNLSPINITSDTGLSHIRASKDSADYFASMKRLCPLSDTNLVQPKMPSLRVQGQKLQGRYFPLRKKQLEWHLNLHAGEQEAEQEAKRITQEAFQEIQQLCERHSWLTDCHLFTNPWSQTSLESLQSQSIHTYEEHIQNIHKWKDRLYGIHPAFTTSNKLLTVKCSHMQKKLVSLLNIIEDNITMLMSDEVKLCSESLISELRKAVDGLKSDPSDFNDFTKYASMVRHYKSLLVNLQQQNEYLLSLHKIIEMTCRKMRPEEHALMQQVHGLWNQFVQILDQAADIVTQRLPSMTNILGEVVCSLTKELEDVVSNATKGSCLDPRQSPGDMVADLSTRCRELDVMIARLNELNRTSECFRGHPLDLQFAITAKQNVEARKGLWELMRDSTAQIQEWKLLLFYKFAASRAQEKVNEWFQQAACLAGVIPSHDAVLQKTLDMLDSFKRHLPVLVKISSPTLKHKHWRKIFKVLDLFCSPDCMPARNVTVADLMSKELWEYENDICKICRQAKAEADMKQEFERLKQSWEGTEFRLARFIFSVCKQDNQQVNIRQEKKPSANFVSTKNDPQRLCYDSGTFTIMGLDSLLAQIEDSIMTLSCMLSSPYVAEFRRETQHWVHLLEELYELLNLCEKYQQEWVFLSRMFYETSVGEQKPELLEKFFPVERTFREMIQVILCDPYVLHFVGTRRTGRNRPEFCRQDGEFQRNLHIILTEGLTVMEDISSQLLYLLDSSRNAFPRFYFLSDKEVLKLVALHPKPSSLLPVVRKCFRGVQWLDTGSERDMSDQPKNLDPCGTQIRVRGVYGSLREFVPFLSHLQCNFNSVAWFGLFEEKLQQALKQQMLKCTIDRHYTESEKTDREPNTPPGGISSPDQASMSDTSSKDAENNSRLLVPQTILQLISEYPVQCLLVAEEILWCGEIQKAFHNLTQTKWALIRMQNTAKLQSLSQAIQNLQSKYTMSALRALILLTMKHSQQIAGLAEVTGDVETSFEWQRLLKYSHSAIGDLSQTRVSLSQKHLDYTEHSVFVDVLGSQLTYGYEYIGPENWTIVNTPSTERAFLGILLSLTSYRCAFISGPPMSGKKSTVHELGWALGQQEITFVCSAKTSSSLIQQLLLGALQTGAWLVLDSVDSIEQGTLSVLGHHLTDIHQCLSTLWGNIQQNIKEQPDFSENVSKSSDGDFIGQRNKNLESQIQFGGKIISAKLTYGCVIISSNGYSSQVPENLRVATRPVSLLQPDYNVIAEVLLASVGFCEATSMSRRMIMVFSLAKDSCCLPDCVSQYHSSWMILLRKVIDASGEHLYNDSEETDESERFAQNRQRSDDEPPEVPDKMSLEVTCAKDHQSWLHRCANKSSILKAVREEQAVIKGFLSVLLPAIFEHKRALKFCTILDEFFPGARCFQAFNHITEEKGQKILRNAITEELQLRGYSADVQTLDNAVTLHQALRSSTAVVLVGPAGSGKTTVYQTLAGAYRRLATKSVQMELEDIPNDKQLLTPWCSVDTVILFPNALSHEELFGSCYEQSGKWKDGVFTKVLRDTNRRDFSNDAVEINSETQKVKWLVLDGEPVTQSGWFDALSSLADPRKPFLCLASGERLEKHESLKILVECTSLGDGAPSALTRCSLVYVSGKDLWKAVLQTNMDALYREHDLDQQTLKMWTCLAEDLFSSTLVFLRQKELATVMSCYGQKDEKSCPGITDGVQEVMSFTKILQAFLEECSKEKKRDSASQPPFTELQAKTLFVVAYIWSFGGQLLPRHWSQFDLYARQALFESRYKIEIPGEGTVFENFFNLHDGNFEVATNVITFSRNKALQHAFSYVPQYGKYAHLLELMLQIHQPVLLVGESGSGKTMLCKSILSQGRSYMHLSGSLLLHCENLRNILEKMVSQKTRLDSLSTMRKHSGLLLFIDDLNEAHFGTNGKTSIPLESLRQCISKGGILISENFYFKMSNSGAIQYLGTCAFGKNKTSYSHISTRLSRLFTTFALPNMSVDILFSIHSAQLDGWLKNFSFMPRPADMAQCIVDATFSVYGAIQENLPSCSHTSHILFSLHDLHKVFQGMCLWDPKMASPQLLHRNTCFCFETHSSALPPNSLTLHPAANILNIARLWMHECWRTFGDRLCSDEESLNLGSVLIQVSEEHFGRKLETECQSRDTSNACQMKGTIANHPNHQHQLVTTIHQDKDESITSRKESVASLIIDCQSQQETGSSEEVFSSDSSFSSSDEDEEEDQNSDASLKGSNNEQSNETVELQPQSAESKTTSPQFVCPTSPDNASAISEITTIHNLTPHAENLCENCEISIYKISLQLLHEMGSSIQNIVFSTALSDLNKSKSQQQFKPDFRYQERDLNMLVQQLTLTIKRRAENDNKPANFVVHHQRVHQLVHILRVLGIPSGHGLLFGVTKKTGRKTTVRLAAYVTGYQLFEVHRRNEDKLKEMLEEAKNQTEVYGRHVIFLIHEDISQATRDELLVVMDSRSFPTLYSDEQKILNMNMLLKNLQKQGNKGKQSQIPNKFFRNKQRNIHMFLLLPLDQSTCKRKNVQSSVIAPHISKALSLCCCVEVYQPWSFESLAEIASQCLKSSLQVSETGFTVGNDLVTSIAQVMAGIHQSAMVYASTCLKIQAFSPQTYMELMARFCHLCDHLCEQERERCNRVSTVLDHVEEMIDKAQLYSEEVVRLKIKTDEKKRSLHQLQMASTIERTTYERTHQHCLLEEHQLSLLEEQLDQAEQQDEDDLQQVNPLYQTALKSLQSLNQSDLDEVRHYRHPPDGVVILMNAICLLFDRPCNWESSKKLLGQSNFLQELIFFDRSNLSEELFQKLGQIVQAPNFQPQSVQGVSRACESLCSWVRAVYECACVQRDMAPWEAHKKRLVKLMDESRARLRVARLQEESARSLLEDMERREQFVRNDLDVLSVQLDKVEAQEKEAAAVVKQMSYYTEKWKRAEREIEMNTQNIPGNALILAAAITYLGPFWSDVRLELLEKWQRFSRIGEINIRPEDPRAPLGRRPKCLSLMDSNFAPVPVDMELRRVLAQALGVDHCIFPEIPPYLVLKLLLWGHRVPCGHHWPLLANVEQHAKFSPQAMLMADWSLDDDGRVYKEEEFELVVSADDPELLVKLNDGVEKGLKVLLTNIERAVPTEELLGMFHQPSGRHSAGVFHPETPARPEFCLFLSTPLPVQTLLSEIHPLILENIKIIDLSLSPSEVQNVILSDILQFKRSELWKHLCQLKIDRLKLQKQLQLEEASLMEYILQTSFTLFEDPEFLPHLSKCQSISQSLQSKIQEISEEMDSHKLRLEDFFHPAGLAADLYKCLQEVAQLCPFYYFPLSNFLFSLKESLVKPKGRTDVRGEETVVSEISHKIVSHILPQYRPCIYQSHMELLNLLMSVALVVRNGCCSKSERVAFLNGLCDLDSKERVLSTSQKSGIEFPSWIPPYIQREASLLEKIQPFQGLTTSLRNSSRQWQEYFRFPSSTVVGPVPCQSHSHLTILQRAILWRTLSPQWLSAVADDLAACLQEQTVRSAMAGGPCLGSPKEFVGFLSRNKGPVIVNLPNQNEDGTGGIHPLHWIKQVAEYQEDKNEVKVTVISFGTECHRDVVLSALKTAVQAGHWLVFNNCHLLDHWDAEVVAHLTQMMPCTAKDLESDDALTAFGEGAESHMHPNFRLWFIIKSNLPCSVPAVVRICAVHVACDSHWDLKEELSSSLRLVLAPARPAAPSPCSENTVEPLIRCAILHSVLSQRQKLKHLGQGSIYNWTQDDLLALVDAQLHIAQHCSDPASALEYIAAYLIYGGHVSDPSDLTTVKAVCRVCLRQPNPEMGGNGPHRLSETISMTGHFDEQDLLKRLMHGLQPILNNTDSQILGFSAEMTNELVKVRSGTLIVHLLQSQEGFTAVRDSAVFLNHFQELPDCKTAHERLQVLQDKIRHWERSGSMNTGPLHDFLQTEWNNLTKVVSSLLENDFKSSQHHSASSYIASTIISHLETQAELLRTYLWEECSGTPRVFCLAAFANPRGFLAALIRESIQMSQTDVCNVSLDFQFLDAASSFASVPSSAVCLSGLSLHGALWDTRLGVLQETSSPNPCRLPLLWVRTRVQNNSSSSSTSSVPFYSCPLYLDNMNKPEAWSLSEENIITHVPLRTKLHPALCTLRKVRLVSTLR